MLRDHLKRRARSFLLMLVLPILIAIGFAVLEHFFPSAQPKREPVHLGPWGLYAVLVVWIAVCELDHWSGYFTGVRDGARDVAEREAKRRNTGADDARR